METDNVAKTKELVEDSCIGCVYVGMPCLGDRMLCDGTIFERLSDED